VLRHQLDQILKEQSRFRLDTWEGISAWFEAMVDMQQNQRGYRGCPLGPITSELLDQGDLLRSRAADAFTRWETVLSDGLRAMQTTGCCARTPIPLPSQTRRSPWCRAGICSPPRSAAPCRMRSPSPWTGSGPTRRRGSRPGRTFPPTPGDHGRPAEAGPDSAEGPCRFSLKFTSTEGCPSLRWRNRRLAAAPRRPFSIRHRRGTPSSPGPGYGGPRPRARTRRWAGRPEGSAPARSAGRPTRPRAGRSACRLDRSDRAAAAPRHVHHRAAANPC